LLLWGIHNGDRQSRAGPPTGRRTKALMWQTLWIAFRCLLPVTNCADEGGLGAREYVSENRVRNGPSLIRVGAIGLDVATHTIGMFGLVALAEDPLSGAGGISVLDEAMVGGRAEVGG
jgi:hypothetical protein